jgi:Beta-propeller repeat/Domain of unknown function DUF11
LNISEELVRLKRRGLGTGLLWSRILPAGLLLATAALAILGLGSNVRLTGANPVVQSSVVFGRDFNLAAQHLALTAYDHLPLMFEPNLGQTDARVKFTARGNGYSLFLTDGEAVLSLGHARANKESNDRSASVIRMALAGARTGPALRGMEPLPGKSNYLIGNDPAKWHRAVPQFARVRYGQVYPGVDLVYYGKQGQLEYDFEVSPGADPKNIRLNFKGSRNVKLESGDLVLETADGSVRLQAPRVYQGVGATQRSIDGRFLLLASNTVGFEIGDYDRSQTLVIDPVLSYSTYLGGSGSEFSPTIAVDSGFNIYVAGSTSSTNFPVAGTAPYQSALKTGATANVFVSKFDPTGATLLFSTYLGGTGTDSSAGIAVDAAGNSYVAGTTTSGDFPTSTTAFQTTPLGPGTHAFVSELDATGATLKYSTYLSGSATVAGTPNDTAKGMTLDNKGFVYVIGITNSTNFPTAPSAGTFQSTLQGASAFFISKVDPSTSGTNSLPFSTYFGGGIPSTGSVAGGGIAVDNNASGSDIYITGGTNFAFTGTNTTTDFPIKNAYQACLNSLASVTTCPAPSGTPAMDAFIAKLNPGTSTGPQLLYSTYVGGTGNDIGNGIALDASGNAYIAGSTSSSDFPKATIAQFQVTFGGGAHDAFVAKINNPITGTGTTSTNVQLTYGTYLGGSGDDVGTAIVVDGIQGARIIGTTTSANLPVLHAIQGTIGGGMDAFVARLDTVSGGSTGTNQFLTFLGGSADDVGTGIAIDSSTNTFVAGETSSGNFPPGQTAAFQPSLAGAPDAFVARLGPTLNLNLTVATPASTSVNAGNQVSFVYTITNNGDTTANVAFQDNLGSGSGTAPATFVSATASGGSCPTTPTNNTVLCNIGILNGGATATVTVNLTPTGSGTLGNSGTVFVGGQFSKSATATPVTVNTFKVAGTPPSVTVVAGQPASYQIALTPQQTYSASISLTCSAGLPGGNPASTCSFSTTPVTLQGTSPSQVTLTISTSPRTTTTVELLPRGGPFYAAWLPITGLAFLGLGVRGRVKRKGSLLGGFLLLALMTLVALQPACGGHSSTTTTTGTPAGTYTVTVSATSGTFSQTTPITLVVQ